MPSNAGHPAPHQAPHQSGPHAAPPPIQTTLPTALALAAKDIKLSHTVFALPFAILAAVLTRPEGDSAGRFTIQLALVLACMTLARTWAMLFNRIADRKLDAANPRTERRAVASGALPVGTATVIALSSAGLFWLAAGAFWPLLDNPWPALLAPLALAWVAFYSLTKRFTALCHLVLGIALALSPLCAAIAVAPSSVGLAAAPEFFTSPTAPALYLIALMVALWVGGFDIIYALQDLDYDRTAGLRSIPARLGWTGAVRASRVLHAAAVAALAVAGGLEPRLGVLYALAVAVVAALLITEHIVLARRGRAGLQAAFFTLNGIVSLVFAALAILDLLA